MNVENRSVSGTRSEKNIVLPSGVSMAQFLSVGREVTDSSGVPLLSDRADLQLNKGRDYGYQGCPFADSPSRYPDDQSHPTPMSGLERDRFLEQYPAMLAAVADLRSSYIGSTENPDASRQLSADELKDVLLAAKFLPTYLVLRANNSVPAKNTIHPSLIVLSNAASGSLGALEGYTQTFGKPDGSLGGSHVRDMIQDAEQRGAMVGDRTVCVAKPQEMRHFIASTIYGPKLNNEERDFGIVSKRLAPEEITQLVAYGKNAYEAGLLYEGFMQIEKVGVQFLQADFGRTVDPQARAAGFFQQCSPYITELDGYHKAANAALGRRATESASIYDFETLGFKSPQMLREMGIGPSKARRLASIQQVSFFVRLPSAQNS